MILFLGLATILGLGVIYIGMTLLASFGGARVKTQLLLSAGACLGFTLAILIVLVASSSARSEWALLGPMAGAPPFAWALFGTVAAFQTARALARGHDSGRSQVALLALVWIAAEFIVYCGTFAKAPGLAVPFAVGGLCVLVLAIHTLHVRSRTAGIAAVALLGWMMVRALQRCVSVAVAFRLSVTACPEPMRPDTLRIVEWSLEGAALLVLATLPGGTRVKLRWIAIYVSAVIIVAAITLFPLDALEPSNWRWRKAMVLVPAAVAYVRNAMFAGATFVIPALAARELLTTDTTRPVRPVAG